MCNKNSIRGKRKRLSAFTLADVLIAIVVIGMVSALVMPTFIRRIKVNTLTTQFKKCHNSVSKALKGALARDGVTKLTDTKLWAKIPENRVHMENITKNGYKDFNDELQKYFKVVKVHDKYSIPKEYKLNSYDMKHAGTPSGYYFLSDETYLYLNLYKTPVTAYCGFRRCSSLSEFQSVRHTTSKLWQTLGYIMFDVNGKKEPNTYGRDIFMFYVDEFGTLYPRGGTEYAIYESNSSACSDPNNMRTCVYHWSSYGDNDSCSENHVKYGYGCAGRVVEEGWKMKY